MWQARCILQRCGCTRRRQSMARVGTWNSIRSTTMQYPRRAIQLLAWCLGVVRGVQDVTALNGFGSSFVKVSQSGERSFASSAGNAPGPGVGTGKVRLPHKSERAFRRARHVPLDTTKAAPSPLALVRVAVFYHPKARHSPTFRLSFFRLLQVECTSLAHA